MSEELDLGIKPKKESDSKGCCGTSLVGMDEAARYPELCFRGPHADLFKDKYGPCSTDDTYQMTINVRIKAFSDGENEYDKRIEFEVRSIVGDVVEEESAKEDKGETEEPVRKLSGSKKA